MGTNYYAYQTDTELAVAADYLEQNGFTRPAQVMRGAAASEIHIGKSSGGWCFSLHVYPDQGINNLSDWLPILKNSVIKDEYGRVHTAKDMLAHITERGWPQTDSLTQQELRRNHAEEGPNGLLRHQVDGHHCVAHGEGTWDCIVGVFS